MHHQSVKITSLVFARSRPIPPCHVNHSDTDNEAVHVPLGRFVAAVHRVHCDSTHPIRLNRFGCADNEPALDDQTDNTPAESTNQIIAKINEMCIFPT